MPSIYEAPESDVSRQPDMKGHGSLEKGVAGEYEFSIGEAISEAWEKTRGVKWTFHLAMLIFFIVVVIAVLLYVTVIIVFPSQFVDFFAQLALTAVVTPLWAGLFIMGVRRAADASVKAGQVLSCFRSILPLLLLSVVMNLLIMIGFILLIIPGIYLATAYILSIPLMVDKNLGFWQALEASRKAVTKRWFSIFGLMLLLTFINIIATIPLGLGLIWTAPMSMIAFGILYRNIFGCSSQTLA